MASLPISTGLEGSIIDNRVQVSELLAVEPGGLVYSAVSIDPSLPSPLIVRLIPNRTCSSEETLARYQEAVFFNHPNLLKCYGAGCYSRGREQFAYALLEFPDEPLTAVLNRGTLEPAELKNFCRDLASALAYLHERNLVHCGLDASTAVRQGAAYKLSDYSQIRPIGDMGTTESSNQNRAGVPPEAGSVPVHPSWDAYGLGFLLAAAASPNRPVSVERAGLAEPFQSIAAACLDADPSRRPSMNQVLEMAEAPIAVPEQLPPPLRRRGDAPEFAGFDSEEDARPRWVLRFLIGIVIAALLYFALDYWKPWASSIGEAAAPAPAPADAGQKLPVPSNAAVDDRVPAFVDDWITTARQRDVEAQTRLYAPRLDAYYRSKGVTRDYVRANKIRLYRRFPHVRKLEASIVENRKVEDNRREVTLVKEWEYAGSSHDSGKTRVQLILRQMSGKWLIESEREVGTYYLRGGNARTA